MPDKHVVRKHHKAPEKRPKPKSQPQVLRQTFVLPAKQRMPLALAMRAMRTTKRSKMTMTTTPITGPALRGSAKSGGWMIVRYYNIGEGGGRNKNNSSKQ